MHLGMYNDLGRSCNIIGISTNTEDASRVVVMQRFGLDRGALFYLPLSEFEVRIARRETTCFRPMTTPVIYDSPPQNEDWLPPGKYRHFKGGEYNCIGVASGDKPKDPLFMVYQSLYGDRIFQMAHRPYEMFAEHVDKPEHGHNGPRFTLVAGYKTPIIASRQQK